MGREELAERPLDLPRGILIVFVYVLNYKWTEIFVCLFFCLRHVMLTKLRRMAAQRRQTCKIVSSRCFHRREGSIKA